jgi:hypothetical protein
MLPGRGRRNADILQASLHELDEPTIANARHRRVTQARHENLVAIRRVLLRDGWSVRRAS